MDLLRSIVSDSCGCGSPCPNYVKASRFEGPRRVFCDACVINREQCHRVYRYCYCPVISVIHIRELFGVDHAFIRSFLHNGQKMCLLQPGPRRAPRTSLPETCRRPLCTTPVNDSSKFCSIACCVDTFESPPMAIGDTSVVGEHYPLFCMDNVQIERIRPKQIHVARKRKTGSKGKTVGNRGKGVLRGAKRRKLVQPTRSTAS
jgi:hypothetical protein